MVETTDGPHTCFKYFVFTYIERVLQITAVGISLVRAVLTIKIPVTYQLGINTLGDVTRYLRMVAILIVIVTWLKDENILPLATVVFQISKRCLS